MISPAVLNGKLYVAAGGRPTTESTVAPAAYINGTPVFYKSVWSYDDDDLDGNGTWTEVLGEDHDQFDGAYYVAMASMGGALWLLAGEGFTGAYGRTRIVYSYDGETWHYLPNNSGGSGSHADAIVSIIDGDDNPSLLHQSGSGTSGNEGNRRIQKISPV